jgi:predicted transcriptional regulator
MFKEPPFNEYKDKVINFLKKNKEKGFSLSELSRELNIKLSLLTTTIYILKDRNEVVLETYGHAIIVKLKSYNK